MQSLCPSFAQNMLLAWHLKDLVKAGVQERSCSSSQAFLMPKVVGAAVCCN